MLTKQAKFGNGLESQTPTLHLENGEWRWNAEGRDKDGRALVFVVVLTDENEEIEIVTAWAV